MNKALLIAIRLIVLVIATNCVIRHANAGGPEYCEPVIKKEIQYVQQEPIYVPIEIEVRKDVTRKNRLSLLIGQGPSENVNVRIISPLTTQIVRPDKDLFGVLYSRDYKRLVFTGMILNNDSALVGIGINW